VKNRKPLEHFLSNDTVELLRLYVREYLPILTRNNRSPYLFPGRKGAKAPQCFRQQINRFVREGTGGLRFHPHAVRKIGGKIYLDEDPGGIEVVRRTLGNSEKVARRVYVQHLHRASHRKFLDALEARRLQAFKPLRLKRKRPG
jgi:integrase